MHFRLFVLGLLLTCVGLNGQTNRIVSPEIHADKRVTFRLFAPKATEAGFFGDWMRPETTEKMTKDSEGVWAVTLGPLAPGIYIYSFSVDGMTIADPVNPKMKLRARTSASLLEVHGKTPEVWEFRDVRHGTVEICFHEARSLGNEPRQAWVYKPPGYDKSDKRYPVLYLLHGSNDTPAGWTTAGRANYTLDNLLADGKSQEMIIVMPFGHAVPFDAPREQQRGNTALFEKYLLNDLMPLIDKKYRVITDKEHRAIVGLSMGGGQSLQIGLGHLDLFSFVGVFSAGVPTDFETKFSPQLQSPLETNKQLKLLWIACGKDDFAFKGAEELSRILDHHTIRHTFRPSAGAHTYNVWRQYFAEIAPLLFQ